MSADGKLMCPSYYADVIIRSVRRCVRKGICAETALTGQRECTGHRESHVFWRIAIRVNADIRRTKCIGSWLQGPHAITGHPERVHHVRADQICAAERQ